MSQLHLLAATIVVAQITIHVDRFKYIILCEIKDNKIIFIDFYVHIYLEKVLIFTHFNILALKNLFEIFRTQITVKKKKLLGL